MPKHHLRPTASSLRRAPSSEPCTEPHSTVRRSSLTSPSHRKVLGAEPQIGERLGERFELEAILGQGSSGKVYAARDLESGRGYALKLLLGVSPSSIYRLKREYRALASIHHPNLVSLEGLFHAEPHWFVVMERIDGRTFVDGLSDDPRATERELRARLEQLALGVGALHAAGLVHRDLKPGNVLVSASGRVVVVDFGLAHERRLAVRSRPRASFAGTPAFAAPEQLEGGAPSYAADRYAIGAMLYLALTGSIPHERGSVAELAARKRSLPPPPSAVRPGVPPDLESLCLALLSPAPEQRPELTEVARVARGAAPLELVSAPAIPEPAPDELPFVGRDAELAALREAFARAQRGVPTTVLVRGESGVGKTRLVDELLRELEHARGATVLRSRCHPRDAVPHNALDGLVDALVHHLEELDPASRAEILPADAPSLARMFPVLGGLAGVASTPRDEAQVRTRGAAALRAALTALASRAPLVIFFDDLHWGDRDSGHLFRALFVGKERVPALVLATFREDEVERSEMLSALPLRDVDASTLTLGALPADACARLARLAAGPDASDARVTLAASGSGGHPYFTILAAEPRALGEGGHALEARIAALPVATRRVLDVVCTAGRPVDLEEISEVGRAPVAAVRELCALRLVRERAGARAALSPYHDHVRAAALADIGEPERAAIHGALGDAARRRAEGGSLADLSRAVSHYRLAHRDAEAAQLAVVGGRRALDAAAFERAVELLRFACDVLGDRASAALRLDYARACRVAGFGGEAAEAFRVCARSAPPDEAFEHRLAAMHLDLQTGRIARGEATLRELADELGMGAGPTLASTAMAMVRAGAVALAPPDRSDRAPDPLLVRRALLAWAASTGYGAESPEGALHFCCEAVVWAARAGAQDIFLQGMVSVLAGTATILGREHPLAQRWLDALEGSTELARAEPAPRSAADPRELGSATMARASYLLHLGQWERARALFEHALRAPPRDAGLPYSARMIRIGILASLTWTGDGARLRELVLPWLAEAQRAGDWNQEVSLHLFASHVRLLDDDVDEAARHLDAASHGPGRETHAARADVWWWTSWALYAGQPELALESCLRAQRLVRVSARAAAMYRTLRALAEGTASAACARESASARRTLDASIRRARRELLPMATPVALHLEALRWAVRDEPEARTETLQRAARAYRAMGMALHAAALQRASGGTEDAPEALSIARNPSRLVRSIVPV